jgi:LssY C-terminus
MSKTITRVMSIFSILLLLFLACIVLIRFYPYIYNFPAYPRITQTQFGAEGDPINLVFVGSKDQIRQSFQQAGWLIPDPITLQTAEKIAADSLAHRSYPTAPVSNLYVFGRVPDLAFEKPTNDVQNRGHIRLWKTGTLIGGQLVWVGQASYDSGVELSGTNHLPTHHIAPTVDLERNTVGADLEKTGLVTEEFSGAFTPPILYARNGGGDYYT